MDIPLSVVLEVADRRQGRPHETSVPIDVAESTRDRIESRRGSIPTDAFLNIVLDLLPAGDLSKDYAAWRERAEGIVISLPASTVSVLRVAQAEHG